MSDTTATDEAAEADAEEASESVPEPARLYGQLVSYSRGQTVLHVDRADLVDVVRSLRDDEDFNVCLDVSAVDYLTYAAPRDLPADIQPERFEVVVLLLSHTNRNRVRIRVQVPESDPSVPSLFEIHPGTEAPEREVYDLFGIRFDGHPDLTRILMPEDWVGHPLRKDYAIGKIPVQFKGVTNER